MTTLTDGYLSEDKRVYIDERCPDKDYFDLYWDNDIVSLSLKDAIALMSILSGWIASRIRHRM